MIKGHKRNNSRSDTVNLNHNHYLHHKPSIQSIVLQQSANASRTTRTTLRDGLILVLLFITSSALSSCEKQKNEKDNSNPNHIRNTSGGEISLPAPDINGNSFLKIVSKRETARDFAPKVLSNEVISDVLYGAYGINRPESGKRTAPSAHNWQYVDLYVSDASGLYLFNAEKPALETILKDDIRDQTGTQGYPATAPLNLVYVVDYAKMDSGINKETQELFGIATVGAIMQNVYLYAASANMVAGVRADIDRRRLRKTMKLYDSQKIILAQSLGYPQ